MTINDHKYQISTRLPTRAGMFDPLLNCPICLPCLRWPFVDLCNKHRQPPPPVRGGGCQQSAPGPVFVLCSSVTNLTCDAGIRQGTLNLFVSAKKQTLRHTRGNKYLWLAWRQYLRNNVQAIKRNHDSSPKSPDEVEIVQWVGMSLTPGHPAWSPVSDHFSSRSNWPVS